MTKKRLRMTGDIAAESVQKALSGLFTVTNYEKRSKQGSDYTILFIKPTKNIAASLALDREALLLIADYEDIQARTIDYAREIIGEFGARLTKNFVMIMHSDRNGLHKLKNWGREQHMTVIPVQTSMIHRQASRAGADPQARDIRRLLNIELFSGDPYQVTGPVSSDMEFFGRRTEAQDLARQLQSGRILSMFGLRKVGKTSLINRMIDSARSSGEVHIAFIDCSKEEFHCLGFSDALAKVANCALMTLEAPYVALTDHPSPPGEGYAQLFSRFLSAPSNKSVALIFDEVDSITPLNRAAPHWRSEFVDFWREMRSFYQESTRRQNKRLSLMVSGVSSKYFKLGQIAGRENPALSFLQDRYMGPFARGAASAMLKELSVRCGLRWEPDAGEYLCRECGDFPYWIRMAASFFHRRLEVERRPLTISLEKARVIFADFLRLEGGPLARVALGDLHLKFPELALAETFIAGSSMNPEQIRIVEAYGLLDTNQKAKEGLVSSGLRLLGRSPSDESELIGSEELHPSVDLTRGGDGFSTSEWAEELAVINRRRNKVENDLRSAIRMGLRFGAKVPWQNEVLDGLASERRTRLVALAGADLMDQLYWLELKAVVLKKWEFFGKIFNDIKRFESAMDVVNSRPDAHAKKVDPAEIALQRRELEWLESCLR